MRILLALFLIVFSSLCGHSQVFVESVHAGDKLPDSINAGGYKEKPQENCSCRVFEVVYSQDNLTLRAKNGTIATVVGIHYKDSIVTGIVKVTLRYGTEDAKQAYESRLLYLRKFVKEYQGAKLIRDHTANPNKENDFNYFAYSLKNGKLIKTIGYIASAMTEEEYIPNSSYKPKYLGIY